MSIYSFCERCLDKTIERDKQGKVVKYECPSLFNPFDEKCTHHAKFMKLERQKLESRENNR